MTRIERGYILHSNGQIFDMGEAVEWYATKEAAEAAAEKLLVKPFEISTSISVKPLDEPRDYEWHEAMAEFDNNPDSEWRLPTRTELAIMYDNRAVIGGFTEGRYWSSSETSHHYSWHQQFSDGAQHTNIKSTSFAVRLVRKKEGRK